MVAVRVVSAVYCFKWIKNYNRWTADEVQDLFGVFAENEIYRELETMTCNVNVWAESVIQAEHCRPKNDKCQSLYVTSSLFDITAPSWTKRSHRMQSYITGQICLILTVLYVNTDSNRPGENNVPRTKYSRKFLCLSDHPFILLSVCLSICLRFFTQTFPGRFIFNRLF